MDSRCVPRLYQKQSLLDKMRANSIARSFVNLGGTQVALYHAAPTIADLATIRQAKPGRYLVDAAPVRDPDPGFIPCRRAEGMELKRR